MMITMLTCGCRDWLNKVLFCSVSVLLKIFVVLTDRRSQNHPVEDLVNSLGLNADMGKFGQVIVYVRD